MAYIYILENKTNGKRYVGQTVNLKNRLYYHKNCNDNCYIHRAIKKYGWDNFEVEVHECSEEMLDYLETALIFLYETMNRDKGYNRESGGNKNKHLSDDLKKRLSDKRKGYPAWNKGLKCPQLSGENNPNYGKKASKELREKLSKAHIGIQAGVNHPMYGRKHTEESKKKMSDNRKGILTGEKHPQYGKHHSNESKAKMSESKKGKFLGKDHPNSKKVTCIETGEVFDCIKYAIEKYDLCNGKISECCKGKRKTTGGYHWQYYLANQESVA